MHLLRFLRWTLIFLICLITGRAGATNAQTTCPLSPRLTIGQQGQVLGTTPNHLRELPTLTGAITGAVPGGSVFDVLAGPECDPASGYNWWQVAYAGQVGWTAEGDATTYFLEPINPALSAPGAGGRIAFTADRDAPLQYEIYLMNADGSDQHNLTQSAGANLDPIWSPDGQQIAFSSNRDGNIEIYVIDSDGSHLRRLTHSPGNDINPIWSPDGHQIAFLTFRDSNKEIYVMNADGSDQRNLTNSPGEDSYPAWSTEGQQIAFTAERDGDQEIYLMQADGSDPHNLTQRANANDYRPVWSPDGRQIAFDSWDDTGNRDIYLMDADGSHLYNLTQDPGEDLGPSWSPDGRQIAFLSARDGSSGIYVINTDGTNLRRLTFEDADREPIWSPENARN